MSAAPMSTNRRRPLVLTRGPWRCTAGALIPLVALIAGCGPTAPAADDATGGGDESGGDATGNPGDTGDEGTDDGGMRLDLGDGGGGGGGCVTFELSSVDLDAGQLTSTPIPLAPHKFSARLRDGHLAFAVADLDGDATDDLWLSSYDLSFPGPWPQVEPETAAIADAGTELRLVDLDGDEGTAEVLLELVFGGSVRLGSVGFAAGEPSLVSEAPEQVFAWSPGRFDGTSGAAAVTLSQELGFLPVGADGVFGQARVTTPFPGAPPSAVHGLAAWVGPRGDVIGVYRGDAAALGTTNGEPLAVSLDASEATVAFPFPVGTDLDLARSASGISVGGAAYFITAQGDAYEIDTATDTVDPVGTLDMDCAEIQTYEIDLDRDGADDVLIRCGGLWLWPGDPLGRLRPVDEVMDFPLAEYWSSPLADSTLPVPEWGVAVGTPDQTGFATAYLLREVQVCCSDCG